MNSIKRSSLVGHLVVGFALLCAKPVLADHLPDDKLASGKADTLLCGLDSDSMPMKEILLKLGKPDRIDSWPTDKVNVTYKWSKGPLAILVNTDQYGDYLDKSPSWIEVSGSDPEGVCPTGRGLRLGDTLATIRKLYGRRYGIRPLGGGNQAVTIQWSTEPSIEIDLARDGRIVRINSSGVIE